MKKILLLFMVVLLGTSISFAQSPPFFTSNTGNSSNAFPNNTTTSNKVQWIYNPGMFTTGGNNTGTPAYIGLIDTVWFRTASTSAGVFTGFEISLGQVAGTDTVHTTGTYYTGLTSCLGPASYTTSTPTGQWYYAVLSTPFLYNPALSLVVEMRQNGYSPGLQTYQISSSSGFGGGSRRIWGGYSATSGSFGTGLADMGISLASNLSCATPSQLTTTNIAQTTLDLGWTENNTPAATTWQIEYGPAGFTPTGTPQITTTNNPHSFTGLLTQNTAYDFYVRAYCGPNDSSYYNGITATTLASCPWPTNLSATSVTSNSAVLDWTENGSATTWNVEIGLSGFTPTGNATFPVTSANKPFTLPGLPSNTCFDYYVQADCGPDSSVYTGPFTFCTTIAPLNCPGTSNPSIVFSEEFTNTNTGDGVNITSSNLPGWVTNLVSGNPRFTLTSTTSSSANTGPSAGAQGSTGFALMEVSCVSGGTDTLKSPSIDLSGIVGSARVKWFNHMYGPNSGKLELFVDNGTTLTSIWSDSGQTQASSTAAWDSAVVNLNAYVGQTINLVYVGTAANPGGCSGDRGIDQIEIEGCVACAAPTALAASNVTATSADLTWTPSGSETAWDVYTVATGGAAPGGTTTPTFAGVTTGGTATPYNLTGLTLYQSVDIYVRAFCSPTEQSSWVGPISVLPCAPLAGTYTIDPLLPASATNFQSFTDAAFALQCGISAPVVFDVNVTSSPYNEQIVLPQVMGSSPTNTITFNGNGSTITAATTATDYAVVRLDGTDYTRWNDLTVSSTSTSNAMSMHLLNSTNATTNNVFTNCTFEVPITATSSLVNPFAMSGSETSPTTACAVAADSNIIDSCTIRGGYYTIAMYGGFAAADYGNYNAVTNCTIEDHYYFATYHLYQNNFTFRNNDISRPTRTTLTTHGGVYASGLGSDNMYEQNRIHDVFGSAPTSTSTFYGFYFFIDASSVANSNTIQNNLIDDIEGNGTHYGIYFSTANNLKVYHNTIVFDNTASTGGIVRGIYQAGTTALGQDIQNNNIYITRGGTGVKHGIWLDAAAAQLTCDYNNVYMGSTAGTNYYGENGGNQLDLTAWQASTPTVGANSYDVDPIFVMTAPDYSPSNATLNGTANPLGVAEDFTGTARAATPDIGAFEFNVSAVDMSATNILSPDPAVGCYTASETVNVEVTNFGAATIDFSVNPMIVTAEVSGTITATLTDTINTGTLPSLGTLSVAVSPTINMTATGPYSINAYAVTTGDPNPSNDTLVAPVAYNVNLVAGTISATPDVICASGTTDVTLSGNAGGLIQWQTSPTGTAPWTNVGSGMNPHTSAVLTSNTFYRAMLTCNSAMDSTNVDTIIVNNPTIGTVITDTVCGADSVTLVAIPTDTSHSVNWYATATSTSPLAAGTDTFGANIIATDTFYAAALAGGLGTPMLITEICNFNGSTGWATPTSPVPSTVQDPIELTNISPSPVDLSGWQVEVTGGSAGTWTFPAGAVVAGNSTVVLGRGTTPGGNVAGQYYQATTLPTSGSGTALGVILSDASATVMDVAAYNGYNVVGTGSPMATAADWSGSVPSGSGTSGIRRTNVDDTDNASDWTVASASNLTNYGSPNVAFTPGGGCEGTRVAVVAVSTPGPAVVASATDTLVCVGDSTALLASGAGVGGTYAWDNGGMTGVNFVPAVSPITYTLTGTDSSGCSSIDSVTLVNADPFSGTATASPDVHCISGSSVIDAVSGAFIEWQESTSPTGPWTTIPGANNTTYNTGNLTSTMYYRALSTCKTTTDTSTVDTVVVENPLLTSTMGDTICGPNSATLMASLLPGSGSTVNWYDAATGGTKLDTGSVFVTPVISATDTFYAVGSAGAGAADTIVPGTHSSIYAPAIRAYWFVAPTDFTITGLFVGTDANPSSVDQVHGVYKVSSFPSTTFQTLFSATGVTGLNWSNVSIPIMTGDTIVIAGWRNGCSYGSAVPITIDGNTVQTYRAWSNSMNYQATAALGGTWNDGGTGSIGRSTFTYSIGCEGTPRTPVVAVVNPSSGDLALTTSSNAASTPGLDSLNDMHPDGADLSYYNPTCELIASIDDAPGGNALGMVTSKVNVDATVNVVNGQPYTRRWYDITPTNNGPAIVSLYYTQADFDDYNAHPSVVASQWDSLPSSPTSPTGLIRVTKLSGGGIGVGTATAITPTSVNWDAVNLRWEITFPVDSFSEFYLHSGQNANNPLSVSLTDFTVVKNGSASDASWTTLTETNNSHFIVQRSADGINFSNLGRVSSKASNGNSTSPLNYAFSDMEPLVGHNYYRLEQVDQNGDKAYSQIIDLVWGADGSVVSVYPNPATTELNIDVATDKVAQLEVRLLDMSGRVVSSAVQKSQKGMTNITLDLSNIATGVYGVQVLQNNAIIHTTKVSKRDN